MHHFIEKFCVTSLIIVGSSGWAQAQHAIVESDNAVQNEVISEVQSDNAIHIARIIADRLSPLKNAFDLPGAPGSEDISGIATGDDAAGWSVWGSFANSWNNNTLTATKSETVSQTVTFGADKALTDALTVGGSFTYTHSDTDTIYNNGNTESDGFTLMPYASYQINDWLSADASFGYTFTSTDQNIAGTTSDYDTEGYMGTFNLNASKWYGYWMTSAKVGLMVNSNKRASYTDSFGTVYQSSTDDLTQASGDLSVGYWMEPMLGYLSVGYAYDLSSEDPTTPGASNDKDEFKLAAGAHIYGTGAWDHVTGGFSLSTIVGREDRENTTAGVNLRIAF